MTRIKLLVIGYFYKVIRDINLKETTLITLLLCSKIRYKQQTGDLKFSYAYHLFGDLTILMAFSITVTNELVQMTVYIL